jgi:hypothetical protein
MCPCQQWPRWTWHLPPINEVLAPNNHGLGIPGENLMGIGNQILGPLPGGLGGDP